MSVSWVGRLKTYKAMAKTAIANVKFPTLTIRPFKNRAEGLRRLATGAVKVGTYLGSELSQSQSEWPSFLLYFSSSFFFLLISCDYISFPLLSHALLTCVHINLFPPLLLFSTCLLYHLLSALLHPATILMD